MVIGYYKVAGKWVKIRRPKQSHNSIRYDKEQILVQVHGGQLLVNIYVDLS